MTTENTHDPNAASLRAASDSPHRNPIRRDSSTASV